MEIDNNLVQKLCEIGIIDNSGTRNHNVGNSDYHEHICENCAWWHPTKMRCENAKKKRPPLTSGCSYWKKDDNDTFEEDLLRECGMGGYIGEVDNYTRKDERYE